MAERFWQRQGLDESLLERYRRAADDDARCALAKRVREELSGGGGPQ